MYVLMYWPYVQNIVNVESRCSDVQRLDGRVRRDYRYFELETETISIYLYLQF